MALAGTMVARRDPRDEARRAYRLFDVDEKGMITIDDLRRVCKNIGNTMSESEMETMIQEFDASGKGGVDENEFIRLMLSRK
jgi:centrin-3